MSDERKDRIMQAMSKFYEKAYGDPRYEPKPKKAKKPKDAIPSEHREQRQVVAWLRARSDRFVFTAVPNGGKRSSAIEGSRLKAEGLMPGFPDLCILSHNTCIEMKKTKGGRLSKEQKMWAERLESIGWTCVTCYGHQEAINFLEVLDEKININSKAHDSRREETTESLPEEQNECA